MAFGTYFSSDSLCFRDSGMSSSTVGSSTLPEMHRGPDALAQVIQYQSTKYFSDISGSSLL